MDDRDSVDAFMLSHGYDAREGLLIKNVFQHPVSDRPDRGNSGAYFNFKSLKSLEAHISEISPKKETKVHRHTCEAVFYVLTGKGKSVIWKDEEPKTHINWEAGDVFVTPMFAWHKHVNIGDTPVRYLEITSLPLMKSIGDWKIETRVEEEKMENAIRPE